jgi:predicted transcriptional regulator
MAEQVDQVMEAEHRTPSELVREALRTYISIRRFSGEAPTPAELRAIRRGEAAYRKGDYVTLDEYFRDVDRRPHLFRRKAP